MTPNIDNLSPKRSPRNMNNNINQQRNIPPPNHHIQNPNKGPVMGNMGIVRVRGGRGGHINAPTMGRDHMAMNKGQNVNYPTKNQRYSYFCN